VGLPVFAGGKGGIGHLVGPTGGYLLGFLPAVAIIGLVTEKTGGKILFGIGALIAATAVIYACGVTWLSIVTGMTVVQSLIVGMVPFLLGDAVKIAAALFIARSLRPMML
jgi:biotin transport system substrate-specific component